MGKEPFVECNYCRHFDPSFEMPIILDIPHVRRGEDPTYLSIRELIKNIKEKTLKIFSRAH